MGDLISREALLEEIKCYQMDIVSKATAMRVIRNAPTVTDTNVGGKWIPCSERLPDTSTQVLVTLGYTYESDYTMYSIARYIHFENGECHWCDNYYGYLEWDKFSDGKGGDSSRRVLAWMPLPEPYKTNIRTSAK